MIDLSLYFLTICSFFAIYIIIESINYIFDFKSFGSGIIFKRYYRGVLILLSNQLEIIQRRSINCLSQIQAFMYLLILTLTFYSIFFIFSESGFLFDNFWIFSLFFLLYFVSYSTYKINQDELNENKLLKLTIIYFKTLVVFVSVNLFKFQNLYFEIICNLVFAIYGLRVIFESVDKKYLYSAEKFDRHVVTVWIIGITSALFFYSFGKILIEIFNHGRLFFFILVLLFILLIRNIKRHSIQVESSDYNLKNMRNDILQVFCLLIVKGGLCKILN